MSLTSNRIKPQKNGRFLLLTFLIALGSAAIVFVPFIIYNGGVFYYYGDFNVQEIPFYQMIHSQVRDGDIGWSHLTDLGTDTLASYSFYLMGSPFFWMTIPFPNEIVPNLIGPLLILKFACAAGAAYIYLQRYVNNKYIAVLGGLLYAFSGFSIYNVFFFHFHEPMIVFPLLLAAFDSFLYDKRRGLLAVAVFAACIVNYYFFVGQALFVLMYYLMLCFTKTYRFRIKEFLVLAFEVVVGFCATAFLLLPSVLGLMGNPRLDELPKNWDSLVYSKPQRYWLIVLSFLFPSDIPAIPVFTPESNCKWASVAGWLPLLGVTGAIGYLQLKKRDWLKKFILLLILFAMIPVLNSMFQLLNSSIFYARWYYMLVLMFVLASLRAIEDREVDWPRAISWSTGLTVGATLFIGVMPKEVVNEDGTKDYSIGVQSSPERFWLYAMMAMLSITAFVLIYKKFWHRRGFYVLLISGTLGVALVSSLLIIGNGVFVSGTTDSIKSHIINARDKIDIDDLEEVRSDFYEDVDNTSMFWRVPSINCFQSSVNTSIMQFYDKVGITRDVASRPNYSAYGLRTLLSCKYFFDDMYDSNNPDFDECFTDKDGNTKMPGWKYLKTCNGFKIYENENYVPMGFAYDSYITEEEFDRLRNTSRPEAILNAMVLTRSQMKKYPEITGYYDKQYYLLYGGNPSSFHSEVDDYAYGSKVLKDQSDKLRARSCSSFKYTKTGFEAEFENDGKETLLFFSVPYSSGFSATVNGEKVDIEKVNYGFMAVRVPSGDSKIVFTYETPGFFWGCIISIFSAALFAGYLILLKILKIRKKKLRLQDFELHSELVTLE